MPAGTSTATRCRDADFRDADFEVADAHAIRARVPLREPNVMARGTNAVRVARAGPAASVMDGFESSMKWEEDSPAFGGCKHRTQVAF